MTQLLLVVVVLGAAGVSVALGISYSKIKSKLVEQESLNGALTRTIRALQLILEREGKLHELHKDIGAARTADDFNRVYDKILSLSSR